MTKSEQLKEHVESLVCEIVRADQSWYILTTIDDQYKIICDTGYGEFFEVIQSVLQERIILAIGKIYDAPNSRYPVMSIATLLEYLQANADYLPVIHRFLLLQEIATWQDNGLSDNATDSEMTQCVARHYISMLPQLSQSSSSAIDKVLRAVKAHRDKRVAHRERIHSQQLPAAKWGEVRRLLDCARQIVSTVGLAYYGMMYTTPRRGYLLEEDAKRAAESLRHLIRKAVGYK